MYENCYKLFEQIILNNEKILARKYDDLNGAFLHVPSKTGAVFVASVQLY